MLPTAVPLFLFGDDDATDRADSFQFTGLFLARSLALGATFVAIRPTSNAAGANLTLGALLAVLVLIVYELVWRSDLSWHAFGLRFFASSDWDPVNEKFGALPFIYGTLVSSLVALVIAVPLALGVAVFTTEMCPKALRGPLSFFVELLAAIPSVIYGLWAIFVLVPLLSAYIQPFLAKTFVWTGLFEGPPYGIGMLAAGIILTLMSAAYAHRIRSEESMLLTAFGDKYRGYMRSTWRLVPWVF